MQVEAGDLVIVHTSFRRVGRVRGGPGTLIQALLAAVGPSGTICMPAHSYGHEDPAYFAGPSIEPANLERLRSAIAPFDPGSSRTTGMGIVAETFRQMTGTLRSSMPLGVSAYGPLAQFIVSDQSLEDPQGIDSPVGRIYELRGKALLIGVNLDRNTSLHVAEAIAETPWRRRSRVHLADGWREFDSRLNCGNSFWRIEPLLHEHNLITFGRIGRARSMCIPVHESVALAAELLRAEPAYFLCTPQTCHACDAARSGYASERGDTTP